VTGVQTCALPIFEDYCSSLQIPVVGLIPFDETVVKAVNRCQSIAKYPDSPAGKAILSIWKNIYNNYLGGDAG
jgi:MinD superfamily P-loop ATPase